MELAAIASAAVPGLAPTGVAGAPDDTADFDSALLVDDSGKQWRVRSPKHVEASMRLETEVKALRAFTPVVKAELPFLIPHIAGSVRQGNISTFVYSHLEGTTRSLDVLTSAGSGMAEELGKTIAAIHQLPQLLVEQADLPSYGANEFRQRKLNELDQAATTGRIPAVLLRRWEHALEDVALWRFSPSVVHGDLHEDHLLISAGRVAAVTGWTDLRIGDPADDFAWLAAAMDHSFVDRVYAAYAGASEAPVDPHIARRASLAAEFALAQWLVRGISLEDRSMVLEAEEMLATLQADVEATELAAPSPGRAASTSVLTIDSDRPEADAVRASGSNASDDGLDSRHRHEDDPAPAPAEHSTTAEDLEDDAGFADTSVDAAAETAVPAVAPEGDAGSADTAAPAEDSENDAGSADTANPVVEPAGRPQYSPANGSSAYPGNRSGQFHSDAHSENDPHGRARMNHHPGAAPAKVTRLWPDSGSTVSMNINDVETSALPIISSRR
ncbi:phosphotransferase [Arthrobacter sp. H41]|uniref:phosphotransferase n=1 Tax=Arthrobacter sp. H41 TaxID=1312978 RepID=UPI0004B3F9F2